MRIVKISWRLKTAPALMLVLAGFGSTPKAQTAVSPGELKTASPLTPAQASNLIGGSTAITLHLKDAEPQVFFEQLWAQAKLAPYERSAVMRATPLISIDCEQKPFWLVVREAAQQSKVSVDEMGSSSADVKLSPALGARGVDGKAIFADPFLMTVSSLERKQKRSVRVGDNQERPPAEDQLQVSFNFFSDPKLPLVPNSTSVVIEQAEDDKGASLLPDQPMISNAGSSARFALNARLILLSPAENGGRLKHLRGHVTTFVATENDTWEIADITQAKGAVRGELPEPLSLENVRAARVAQYVVKECTPTDKGYALEFSYLRSVTALENRALTAAVFSNIRFVDNKGEDLYVQRGGGRGMFGVSDKRNEFLQGYTQRLQIVRGAKNSTEGAVKMIWRIPTEFQQVVIPFDFSDLPLP